VTRNLRDVQLGHQAGRGAPLVEQRIDLGLADANALHHLAFTHALDQHLVADSGAKLRVFDAILAQLLAQLGQRQLVLQRNARDRSVDLGLVELHPAVARIGDLHPLVDQGVHDLLAQDRQRRQVRLAARRFGTTRSIRCCTSPAVTSSWLTTATM
jgi:hypothetical protein